MTRSLEEAHLGDSEFAARPLGLRSSILDTIGGTPIVRLNRLCQADIELFVKLEAFNPMGSVKDRMAKAVIEAAENAGALSPGQTVIEATSGNTGIGLAMVCAQKGYPLVIVMPENFSLERRKLLRFLGAKVVLTPAAERGTGMFIMAERLSEKHGWFFCRQFENEANADVHSSETAQEILSDFADIGLDYWVTGFGTGGTLKGTARVLKSESPSTRIVVTEPENSQILNSGIEQKRRPDGAAARSHPNARAHPIQGWSPDFIPKLADDARLADLIDQFMPVSGHDALHISRQLAVQEGILCGPSGGATVAAALALAETVPSGSRILAMVPDTGERYLSTPLFEDVPESMTEEETAIATSVGPLKRVISSPAKPRKEEIDPEAVQFVRHVLADEDNPIVMFGFEWCEFCWSVRRLFEATSIPFRSVDVDSKELREDDRGGRILRALFAETGMRTVPQVFVGGKLVGGANDVLSGFNDGTLHSNLGALKTPIVPGGFSGDAKMLLPNWTRPAAA